MSWAPSHGVRRRAWTVMRTLADQGRRFTAAEVAAEIRTPIPRVEPFVRLGLLRGVVIASPQHAVHAAGHDAAGSFATIPLSLAADAPAWAPRPTLAHRGRAADRTSQAERAWRVIAATTAPFTFRSIIDAGGVSRQILQGLLSVLVTVRYVEVLDERNGSRGRRYSLLDRGGRRPPARQDDGSIVDPNDGRRWSASGEAMPSVDIVAPPPVCDRAWLALRAINGVFTIIDVALLADVSESTALRLVNLLERIGYVVRAARGRPATFRLIVRSGPRAPRSLSGGGFIDPNDGRRWTEAGEPLPAVKHRRRS